MTTNVETAQAPAEAAPTAQTEAPAQAEAKPIPSDPISADEAMRAEAREFMDQLKAEDQKDSQPKAAEPEQEATAKEEEAKPTEEPEADDADDEDLDDFESEEEDKVEAKPRKRGRLYRARKKIGVLTQEVEKKDSEIFEWQKLANEQHLELEQLKQQVSARTKAFEEEGFEFDPRVAEIERRDQEIARLKHEKLVAEHEAKRREEASRKQRAEQMQKDASRQLQKAFKEHGLEDEQSRQDFLRELTKEVRALGKYVDPLEFAERYAKQLKALRFYEEQQQRQAQVSASSRAPSPVSGRTAPFDPTMGSNDATSDDARAYLQSLGLL